jgi:hypothetical protein
MVKGASQNEKNKDTEIGRNFSLKMEVINN